MASASRRKRREDVSPRFFVDRALGKVHVPGVFLRAGFEVLLMAELYPRGEDQRVGDDRWIMEVSELGMVALTKDVSILRDHKQAIEASGLRVFALTNAQLTGPQMASRFEANLHRIVQRSRKPGPFVDVVKPSKVSRRWPK